jgi:hypothetical protein
MVRGNWENILKSRGSHYEKFKEEARNAGNVSFRRMCRDVAMEVFREYKPTAKDRVKYLREAGDKDVSLKESELMKIYAVSGIKRLLPYTKDDVIVSLIKKLFPFGMKISGGGWGSWGLGDYRFEIKITFAPNLFNIVKTSVNLFTPYATIRFMQAYPDERLLTLFGELQDLIGDIEGLLTHEVPTMMKYKYKGKKYVAMTKRYDLNKLSVEEFGDLISFYDKEADVKRGALDSRWEGDFDYADEK